MACKTLSKFADEASDTASLLDDSVSCYELKSGRRHSKTNSNDHVVDCNKCVDDVWLKDSYSYKNSEEEDSEEEMDSEERNHEDYPNFVKSQRDIEDEDLMCLICHMVAVNPQQSQCCGKIYCQQCVEKFSRRNSNPKCPTCRKYGVEFFEDKRASRAILGLTVYCSRKGKGCKWQGALSDLDTHIDKCDYRLMVCPNNCGRTLRQRKLSKHLKGSCPTRDTTCSDCGEAGQWMSINGEHAKLCLDKFIPCINEGCGEKVKRRNLQSHLLVCSKTVISCNYADLGCTATFKREDLAKHEKKNKRKHCEYAIKKARRPMLHKHHLHQVAPVVLTIDEFSCFETARSLPFFSSIGGHKMSLLAMKENNNAIGIFLCMMLGECDCQLQWPFEGEITVELLNQVSDGPHVSTTANVFVVKDSLYTMRNDENSEYCKGIEIGTFSLNNGELNSSQSSESEFKYFKDMGYLVDDCLYFRVTCRD